MAQFSVVGGQIVDPNGRPFVARGINVFLNQVDPATILKLFPGINAIRLATTPGADETAIDALVQGLTSKGVVVLIEDHSSSGGNPNTSSGPALTNEAKWYAGLASKYHANPYVWFGTANEPDNTANPAAIPAQEAAIYNAVRGAGSNAIVLMEMRGGFTNDAAQQNSLTYAGMSNVAWDTHYYGWVTNQSTDPAIIAKGLAAQIANAQSVKSADGIMPVVIGEYGPSSSGIAGYDANGLQVVQAVHDSGKGTFAWAYSAGTDTLVANGATLSDFGRMVAQHIAAGASTPPPGGSGPDILLLNLAEDAYQGDAQAIVTVDGKASGGTLTVTALRGQGASQVVTLTGQWGPGAHDIGVQFINDAYGGTATTDRNLYVNGITLDGRASATPAATLYSNGACHFAVAGALVLHLSEDAYLGDAQFVVAVDGKALGAAQSVTALHAKGAMQDFAFGPAMAAGTHDVAVSFLNDAYAGTPATDRNLYVDGIDAYGSAMAGASAALLSASTQHFSIVVAAHT